MSIWTTTGADLGALLRAQAPQPVATVATRPTPEAVRQALAIIAADKAWTRKARNTFSGFDDFMPAFTAARARAAAEVGERWYLDPTRSVKAQVPAAWVRWVGKIASGRSPRDVNFPVARFWPGGVLPVGPVYADPVQVAAEVLPPERNVVPMTHRLASAETVTLELSPDDWDWREAAD